MNKKRLKFALIISLFFLIIGLWGWFTFYRSHASITSSFNSQRALKDVQTQVSFGARIPDSQAHKKTIEFIQKELTNAGWSSKILQQNINGHTAINILATHHNNNPVILLGAHYDSRLYADNDPDPAKRNTPVPGANDGASGVAVLLELARSLPDESVQPGLLFIDIEDNGHIPGWDWIQGSQAFAETLAFQPKAVVILDMIGDADLNIFMEQNSDSELSRQIWITAKDLGYAANFIPEYKYTVLDDHIPFIKKGIHAVDIIDLDYPYWHTTQDTPDKVSATSLKIIGETILKWIHSYGLCIELQNCSAG
jgi:glutaminyl-peptide cyclotransferase